MTSYPFFSSFHLRSIQFPKEETRNLQLFETYKREKKKECQHLNPTIQLMAIPKGIKCICLVDVHSKKATIYPLHLRAKTQTYYCFHPFANVQLFAKYNAKCFTTTTSTSSSCSSSSSFVILGTLVQLGLKQYFSTENCFHFPFLSSSSSLSQPNLYLVNQFYNLFSSNAIQIQSYSSSEKTKQNSSSLTFFIPYMFSSFSSLYEWIKYTSTKGSHEDYPIHSFQWTCFCSLLSQSSSSTFSSSSSSSFVLSPSIVSDFEHSWIILQSIFSTSTSSSSSLFCNSTRTTTTITTTEYEIENENEIQNYEDKDSDDDDDSFLYKREKKKIFQNLWIQPDLFQNDIYYVWKSPKEFLGLCLIPNFQISQKMNSHFRIIKENQNLDLLEESDNDDNDDNNVDNNAEDQTKQDLDDLKEKNHPIKNHHLLRFIKNCPPVESLPNSFSSSLFCKDLCQLFRCMYHLKTKKWIPIQKIS